LRNDYGKSMITTILVAMNRSKQKIRLRNNEANNCPIEELRAKSLEPIRAYSHRLSAIIF